MEILRSLEKHFLINKNITIRSLAFGLLITAGVMETGYSLEQLFQSNKLADQVTPVIVELNPEQYNPKITWEFSSDNIRTPFNTNLQPIIQTENTRCSSFERAVEQTKLGENTIIIVTTESTNCGQFN